MSSPIFTENSPFARGLTTQGSVGSVMTLENTMRKSVGLFALTVAAIAVGWFFLPLAMTLPLMIAALVMSLVACFKKEPSPPLYIATVTVYGLAVGAISAFLEQLYEGVVSQAVLGTVVVIGVVFALYRSGKFRSSPKMTKFFVAAMFAYLAFSLVNVGIMIFGDTGSAWGLRGSVEIFGIPLGVFLGAFAVLLGAYSLLLDFEYIENGVRVALPEKYGWTAAYGLTMTIVWIYVEILRLASILRGN